jgi:hypothetical protein
MVQMEIEKANDTRDRLNQRGVASVLGRSVRFVQYRERTGAAPPSVKQGRERIYSRAGVLAWARAQGLLP